MEDDNLGFSQTCFFTILMTLCYADLKIVSEFVFHMQPYYHSPRFIPLLYIYCNILLANSLNSGLSPNPVDLNIVPLLRS